MMKKLLLIFFSVMLTGWSATGQSIDSLTAKWQLDWAATIDAMDENEKERFQALPKPIQERIESTFSTRVFHFTPDGLFEASWLSEQGEKRINGIWSQSTKSLTITVGGMPKSYDVDLQHDTLSLKSLIDEASVFSSLIFNKM
jgi:hypothetical protein